MGSFMSHQPLHGPAQTIYVRTPKEYEGSQLFERHANHWWRHVLYSVSILGNRGDLVHVRILRPGTDQSVATGQTFDLPYCKHGEELDETLRAIVQRFAESYFPAYYSPSVSLEPVSSGNA